MWVAGWSWRVTGRTWAAHPKLHTKTSPAPNFRKRPGSQELVLLQSDAGVTLKLSIANCPPASGNHNFPQSQALAPKESVARMLFQRHGCGAAHFSQTLRHGFWWIRWFLGDAQPPIDRWETSWCFKGPAKGWMCCSNIR